MLFVLFQLGADRYALPADQVIEVLPLVGLKTLPATPNGVSGVVDYRGEPVPVVDISQLALDQPAQQRVSTRLLMVRYPRLYGGENTLGIIVERATELMHADPEDFQPTGIDNTEARYLGPVKRDADGMIQQVDVRGLLTDEIHAVLFPVSTEVDL